MTLNNGAIGTRFTIPFYLEFNELVAIMVAWRALNEDKDGEVPKLSIREAEKVVVRHLYGVGALSFEIPEEDEHHTVWAQETVRRVFGGPQ